MNKATLKDLKQVIALRNLPEAHLQWIYDRCTYEEYADGEVLIKSDQEVDSMYFQFEGKYTFYMDVNGKLVYYFTFGNNDETGGAIGLLPYSRMKTSPGYAFASGTCKLFRLHKKYFQDLEQLNPELIQRLIGYMTERARTFATQKLQYEKVNALGQLAAGVAHELNNPAAAINRISSELNQRLLLNYELTEGLLESKFEPAQLHVLRIAAQLKQNESKPYKSTALERIEREDQIAEWLESINIFDLRDVVETLAENGFTVADLNKLCDDCKQGSISLILRWFANIISSQKMLKDLDDASCRISNLVGAIKSHVHMDKGVEMQATHVHKDIDDTLTLLGYKLREKNIQVVKDYCKDMNEIQAYIGELNQVWTNLIDNAIYALPSNGILNIKTSCNSREIMVCVRDNGVGIPQELVSRIFDPFFTTKKVGEGTGIGLDLAMRIVKRHNGEIKVKSEPGNTEFSVYIPLQQTQSS